MNIVFWLGVVVAAVIVWYLLSRSFFNIGSNFKSIVGGVKDELNRTEENEQEENKE